MVNICYRCYCEIYFICFFFKKNKKSLSQSVIRIKYQDASQNSINYYELLIIIIIIKVRIKNDYLHLIVIYE